MVVSIRAQLQAEESVGVGMVRSHVPCSGVTVKAVLRAPRCSVRETYFILLSQGLMQPGAGLKLTP